MHVILLREMTGNRISETKSTILLQRQKMKQSIPGYPIFNWLNAGKINLFNYFRIVPSSCEVVLQ